MMDTFFAIPGHNCCNLPTVQRDIDRDTGGNNVNAGIGGGAMQRAWVALWLACLCLQGCATGYGATGLTGGYEESRVNARLIKVNFYGNGYIKSDKVQAYALYRCAEVARYAKKPYLVLYDSLTAAARDRPASQPRVGSLGGKPIAFAVMVLEDRPRDGSQDVAELLARLGPEVLGTPGDGKAAP